MAGPEAPDDPGSGGAAERATALVVRPQRPGDPGWPTLVEVPTGADPLDVWAVPVRPGLVFRVMRIMLWLCLLRPVGPWLATALVGGLLMVRPLVALDRSLPDLRRRLRRRLDWLRLLRAPAGGLESAAEGSWVKVAGRVLPGQGVRSASGVEDCVVAQYLGGLSSWPAIPGLVAQGELHAVRFSLVTDDQQLVEIDVQHLSLLGRRVSVDADLFAAGPLASRTVATGQGSVEVARVLHEETIAGDDRVEVLGQLRHELDPTAAAGYRSPGLKLVLTGSQRHPLVLRRSRA